MLPAERLLLPNSSRSSDKLSLVTGAMGGALVTGSSGLFLISGIGLALTGDCVGTTGEFLL